MLCYTASYGSLGFPGAQEASALSEAGRVVCTLRFFTCPFLKLSFPWAKWSPSSRSRSRGRGLFESSLERPASRASGASRGGTAPIFRKVAPSREVRARARELFSLVDDAISRYKDQALRRSPLPRFFFSFFFLLVVCFVYGPCGLLAP